MRDFAARLAVSSAFGCVHTTTPTTPPNIMLFDPSSEYDQRAIWSAAWMRLAMPRDSFESQYAVTMYSWLANFTSLLAMRLNCSSDSVRSASLASASAAALLAETMSFSNESASCLALRASAKAFNAAARALLASLSTFPSDFSAFPALASASSDFSWALLAFIPASLALFSAMPDLSRADCAFVSADLALSLREPINCPDREFVRTRQRSSSASEATSKSVDRLLSLFLRSSIPSVNQSVNSATYSPAQATVTKVAKTYSPISQRDNAVDRDSTSVAVKVTLDSFPQVRDQWYCCGFQTAPGPADASLPIRHGMRYAL